MTKCRHVQRVMITSSRILISEMWRCPKMDLKVQYGTELFHPTCRIYFSDAHPCGIERDTVKCKFYVPYASYKAFSISNEALPILIHSLKVYLSWC